MESIKEFPRGIRIGSLAMVASTEATSVHLVRANSKASSLKHQASSAKLVKQQAASFKPFATSIKLQATSFKLQDPGPFVKFHGARTKGLYHDKTITWMLTWKAIWCGEKRTLLLFVTLSSTVKKCPELL
jgi:hypothetical protein